MNLEKYCLRKSSKPTLSYGEKVSPVKIGCLVFL